MSEKSTLDFYFSKTKANVVPQANPSDSIQPVMNEHLSDQVFGSNNSAVSSSNSSSSTTPTINLDVSGESIPECSQAGGVIIADEPFKRDPSRGPTFAKEFASLGPCQPKCHYPTVEHRHFCHQWFQKYKWLEYSVTNDKAYCFVCRFAHDPIKSDNAFTIIGFNNWRKSIEKFEKHQSTALHKQAHKTWVNAEMNRVNNTSVLKQINRQFDEQVEENRRYLTEIVRAIMFLGKQCLSFRGHREDEESENRGNFLELLELRSLDNETIRKNVRSLKFTDHKIQNEVLILIQENITNQIVSDIKKAKYFSVMIDETTDISRHEQVSLVIRYVDDLFHVFERFIGFERTLDTTGESLFNLLVSWIKELDLDLRNIVGQCYDGASAMRGGYKGVVVRLKQLVPKAIYVHCNGHVLNLCLIDVSPAITPIRKNFGVIQALYNLIEGSAKRHHVFEDVQKQAGLKPFVMKRLCDTRWTCRSECLNVIVTRYPEILNALVTLDNGDGLIILNTIKTMDFIFHLLIMSEIYSITNILSRYLQHSDISLTSALVHVRLTIETLMTLRTESKFEEFWNKTIHICEANSIDDEIDVRKRKISAKFGGGSVIPDKFSTKDNYRVNSYYAVLDKIIAAIGNRFDENNVGIVVLCEKVFLTKALVSSDELRQLSTFYELNYNDLQTEQLLYKTAINLQQAMDLKSITQFFLQRSFHLLLPTMNELLRILWMIPVNVCECERSFSSLRRLKTYLRNTMNQERLSALALIHIERNITVVSMML